MPYKDIQRRRDYHKNYNKNWALNNPLKIKIKSQKWRDNNKPKIQLHNRVNWKRGDNYRQKILDIIGRKCIICGESDEACIQIDHINDDGYKIRRTGGEKRNEYISLSKNPLLMILVQTLCSNCNWKKRSIRYELLRLERWNLPPF